MPQYKLTYFDVRARAEVSRYLFALAGVEYEDNRISNDEWKQLKTEVPNPFGQLPILEVDGKKVFYQSHAIAAYLALEFGLHGNNNMEKYRIEMITDSVTDMSEAMFRVYFEKDEVKKAEMNDDFKNKFMPNWLAAMEKIFKEGNSDYFVGNRITLADVHFFHSAEYVMIANEHAFDKFPGLRQVFDRIAANPKIAEWRNKRPKTQF